MKYALRTIKWFMSKDGRLVEGVITKRELLESDDPNDGKKELRRYYLHTSWQGCEWVDEDDLFDTKDALVNASYVTLSPTTRSLAHAETT